MTGGRRRGGGGRRRRHGRAVVAAAEAADVEVFAALDVVEVSECLCFVEDARWCLLARRDSSLRMHTYYTRTRTVTHSLYHSSCTFLTACTCPFKPTHLRTSHPFPSWPHTVPYKTCLPRCDVHHDELFRSIASSRCIAHWSRYGILVECCRSLVVGCVIVEFSSVHASYFYLLHKIGIAC